MRVLAAGLFALTAGAMALGSGGLVVVPHPMQPGTEAYHAHPVGALRFPILTLGEAPGLPLAAHLRERHASHLEPTDGPAATIEASHPLAVLAGGAILALLAYALPRLPRRPKGPPARISPPRPKVPQWLMPVTSPPPRLAVFDLP